jgi:hypothetical protein
MELPYRGSLPAAVPTDPLIYRFYELISVYGTIWKELIYAEFGDGIMSAIDFDMTLHRQPDQKRGRVKTGMSGKFLAYKHYRCAQRVRLGWLRPTRAWPRLSAGHVPRPRRCRGLFAPLGLDGRTCLRALHRASRHPGVLHGLDGPRWCKG